ncbi:MAG: thioredoxin domain-containing protein [Patescibacteria group bacterium]
MPENKPSLFELLNPKQTFVAGIVGGFLAICTVGFFVLTAMFMNNGGFAPANKDRGGVALAAPSNNVQAVPTAGIKITVKPVDEKTDHIRGNKNANITIIGFSDFECPFCKRFHETMNQIIDSHGDSVRWVFRQMPLDSLHRQARTEALATECAGEQGKFWELADLIFDRTESNDGLDLDKLPDYAKEIGLNVNNFNDCLKAQKYASAVEDDERDGQAAGGRGTPYSVLIGPNGETQAISGAQPFSAIEAAIQQYL